MPDVYSRWPKFTHTGRNLTTSPNYTHIDQSLFASAKVCPYRPEFIDVAAVYSYRIKFSHIGQSLFISTKVYSECPEFSHVGQR